MRAPIVSVWISVILLSTLHLLGPVEASPGYHCSSSDTAGQYSDLDYRTCHPVKYPQKTTYSSYVSQTAKRSDIDKDIKYDTIRKRSSGSTRRSSDAEGSASSDDHHSTVSSSSFHFRAIPRSTTYHKNGKVYMVAHQDWYTKYRQHRGPHGVVRKLNLESPRRKKVHYVVPIEDDEEIAVDSKKSAGGDGYHSKEGGGRRHAKSTHRISPKYVGKPHPVSTRHEGLIPKARSDAGNRKEWVQSGIWTQNLAAMALFSAWSL
ncbi:hypothetical protein BC939DRAFT_448130 [Gamsiella multidivaricata]|uniref:uncharacterized protein n=1 Tax=Gamsiella multidivaricata TaxID=101098 RepID=UPI00221EFC75|nr:uncharacterized protein BC939DRAFT_448130 [Gamsiella multidivaricata]KAI7825692.1 hypothetical protein BC939DRAFT_448130 [Gamsiella multidivaricata]